MKRKIVLFLALGFSTLSFGQFKTINGTFGKEKNNEPIKLLTPPSQLTFNQEARDLPSDFVLNPLHFSDVKDFNHNGVKNVLRDTEGNLIGVELSLSFSRESSLSAKVEQITQSLSMVYGFSTQDNSFEIQSNIVDELGMHHVKIIQKYKDVKIYGGESIIHGQDGIFDFVNGEIFKDVNIDIEPTYELQEAENIAVSDAGKLYDKSNDHLNIFDLEEMTSELVIYPFKGEHYLAYHHSFYTDLMHRWEYFVDAHAGNVINKYESVCKFHNHKKGHSCDTHNHSACEMKIDGNTANNSFGILGAEKANATDLLGVTREIDVFSVGSNYYMIDASRDMYSSGQSNMPDEPVGAIWTIDAFNTSPQNDNFSYGHVTSSNNSWGDKGSVSAQFNGARAYLYFKNLHGRNSINGSGGNIIGLVNVADSDGQSLGNAFWNGAAMFYGSGDASFKHLAGGLDVAGHEMTHGVVQNTANLEYQGESGALNESFADVFGVMIDRDDWLIGEDVVKTSAFPSGALRNMQNPHNGASTGNFNAGWQPKKYSERYTGSADNGGVHINSGIPNHAFYLFASDSRLGSSDNDRKVKAERVYYRALANYLTKSSNFVDCRIAVVKAAGDLYDAGVVAAAREAFDKVEVFGEDGGNYQKDAQPNPGDDLILFTQENNDNLYIFTPDGNEVANPLSTSNPISKPSVTDAGNVIVFVADDKKVHYLTIDWNAGTVDEQTLNFTGINEWRNTAISKDGRLLAVLRESVDNEVVVVDLATGNGISYELKNPTYTTGISTGDVLYADAMEFDYSGRFLMYDAKNNIESNTGGSIEFWDIGFIEVWDKQGETFAEADQISKLFQGLPEGVSVGNPVFAKNSNYIIAFDLIEQGESSLVGANIETGKVGLVFENSGLAYPSYSRLDDQIIFDNPVGNGYDLGIAPVNSSKIEPNGQAFLYFEDVRWGSFFSNGIRDYNTSIGEENLNQKMIVSPNPSSGFVFVELDANKTQEVIFHVYDIQGKKVLTLNEDLSSGDNTIELDLNEFESGTYFIHTVINDKIVVEKVIKM